MERERRLATYLGDHLAGSEAAIRLVRRYAEREPSSPLGLLMADLLQDIEQDRDVLKDLMARLGASPNPVKRAGAIGAELVSSLRGRVPVVGTGSEEVALLEDLELLCLGIQGKLLLWRALGAPGMEAFEGVEFAELAERAEDQRDRVEAFRLEAATAAFWA